MGNVQNLFLYTIELLKSLAIRHEYTNFDSGAIMLDIWYNNKFYVIQFVDNYVGFSEINDNTGFDTIPDEKFNDEVQYFKKLYSILPEGHCNALRSASVMTYNTITL